MVAHSAASNALPESCNPENPVNPVQKPIRLAFPREILAPTSPRTESIYRSRRSTRWLSHCVGVGSKNEVRVPRWTRGLRCPRFAVPVFSGIDPERHFRHRRGSARSPESTSRQRSHSTPDRLDRWCYPQWSWNSSHDHRRRAGRNAVFGAAARLHRVLQRVYQEDRGTWSDQHGSLSRTQPSPRGSCILRFV